MNFIKKILKSLYSGARFKTGLEGEVNKKQSPIETTNELNFAWKQYKIREFDKCIEEAEKYLSSSNSAIVYESKKVIALALFQKEKYTESELLFQEISANSENSDDWFNLATSATLNRNIALAEIAFNKAVALYKKNGTKENVSIPNMHCFYMQGLRDIGEFEKAFIHFKKLTAFYAQLGVTDSTFLHMRGMPFFEHFTEASTLILKHIDSEIVKRELVELKSKLDAYGKKSVKELESKIYAS